MTNILIVTILSLFLFSCDDSGNIELVDEMQWLNQADPLEDSESAIARSDYRFIGLYGVGAYVPVVNIQCLDPEKDVKYIKGTSDLLENYEHSKLNAIAQVYAEYYNMRMLVYLQKYKELECAVSE